MLKQKRQFFELLFVAADLVVVSVAWCLAYWLRFKSELVPVEKGIPPFSDYLPMLLFIWLIWTFMFRRLGLYRPMRGVRRARELLLLIQGNLVSLLLFIAVTYLFREKSVPFSRLVFVYFGLIAILLTIMERSVLRSFLREIRRRGYNLRYLLLVGAGKVAEDIATRVRLHREMGIQLIGCLSKDGIEKRGPRGLAVLGKYSDLPKIMETVDIDQIVVALPLEDHHMLPDIMSLIGDSLVDVKIIPDIYQFVTLGGTFEEFDGLPIISVRESPIVGFNLILKRVMDLLLSTILIIILSPLLLLIAILVKLTSRGSILFKQERVSVDGTRFSIFKFRTMHLDAEVDGPGWTTENDSRVTPFGKFLRSFSLDELPQLFNVIRGEMSIVGPRPERPIFIEQFRSKVPRYMLRHKVPAGMTGWAQVHGWRGNTSIDKRIEFDLYYIENWSLGLDLKILFLTLLKGFRNNNAY